MFNCIKKISKLLLIDSGGHEIAGHKNGWPKTKDDYDDFWNNSEAMNFYYDDSRLNFFVDVFESVKDKISGKVLDVGCGDGYFLNYISDNIKKYNDGNNLTGFDYSKSALLKLKKRLPKVAINYGDVTKLPYDNETFDTVLIMETLEHVVKWKDTIIQCLRVLKKNNYLVITIPNGEFDKWEGHTNFWNESKFRNILDALLLNYEFNYLEEGKTFLITIHK